MRKAFNDYGIIVDDGKFIGIALGYDYCSEHEWGISGIKRVCGIPESSRKCMGIDNRTIRKVPEIKFSEVNVNRTTKNLMKGKYAILYVERASMWKSDEVSDDDNLPYVFNNWRQDLTWNHKWNQKQDNPKNKKDNIITAWDEDSFGVAVMGEKEVQYLKELKEAIETKNFSIASANFRAVNPFAGTSLCLLIRDRIPQDVLNDMYIGDKSHYDKEDYEKKIGMKKLIEKKGNKNGYHGLHYFMACSPKWINYEDKEDREKQKKEYNTKYDIMYWINYSDDDNNCGWYTVEEIKQWLKGKKKLTEIRKA